MSSWFNPEEDLVAVDVVATVPFDVSMRPIS